MCKRSLLSAKATEFTNTTAATGTSEAVPMGSARNPVARRSRQTWRPGTSTSEAARAMIEKLKKQGYKSYVAAGAAARDGRWRVRIGPYATREAADSKAALIKREQKLPTWVLSEEG